MSLRSWRAAKRTRTSITIAIAFACLAGVATLTRAPGLAAAASASPIAQKLAVPSYIHPLGDPGAWTRLVDAKPGVVGISMANVLNGPDFVAKPEWAAVIQRAHAAGQKVLGYVDSGYFGTTGLRTRAGSLRTQDWTAQIERDVDAWYAFYGPNIDGIFFDQGQNACGPTPGSNEYADLYRAANEHVKRNHPGALTVINPGTGVPQCFETTADVLLTFESDYAAYIGQNANPVLNYKPLSWTPVDPDKIWHLIYAASESQVADAIQKSQERNVGWVYVTDDVMVNPWDTLPAPSYWELEQSLIAPVPPVGTTGPGSPTVTVTQSTATSITISWTPAAPGSAPIVGYDVLDHGSWIESTRGDTTSWTVVDLDAASAHDLSIVARDAFGARSAPSASIAVATGATDPSPPSTPGALTASGTDYTTTELSWSPSVDAEGPISGYTVALDGKDALYLPATATSVLVGELPTAATSTFSVVAWDASGQRSLPSAPVSVTTLALPEGRRIVNPSVVQRADAITYHADFLVPFSFRRVFIATGGTDPCWRSNTAQASCVSYLVENGALQKYVGDGTRWGWSKVKDLTPVVDGYSYTWTIAPADIGSPPTHQVLFNAEGYAPLTYTDPPITATAPLPVLPDLWIGGGNPSGFRPCSCSGTDIDPLTGELAVVERDLNASRSSRGSRARTLTRTYSSTRAGVEGRFGAGWIDSYDLHLGVVPGTTAIAIRQENGSVVVFTANGDGTYAALPTFDATLTAQPDGTWTFVRKGVATFTFDARGRLTGKSGADESLTLQYDDQGLLRTVRSTSGADLTFDYIGSLVVRVTDSRGRRISYGYDDKHDLRTVRDDDGPIAAYEYQAHLLTTVDRALDDRSTTYGYDAESRVRTRINDRWQLWSYDYAVDPTTLDGSSTVTSGRWAAVTRSAFAGGDLIATTYDVGTSFATTVTYENDPTTRAVVRMTDPDGSISERPFDDDRLDCVWW